MARKSIAGVAPDTAKAATDIIAEVERQKHKYKDKWDDGHSPTDWGALVATFALENRNSNKVEDLSPHKMQEFRESMVRAAASSMSAIRAVDRALAKQGYETPTPLPTPVDEEELIPA